MENNELKKLIDSLVSIDKETEWLEFKQNFHSCEEIGERISAIANSACLWNRPYGYIVFGIESHNYAIASRIIKDALLAKVIKEENPDSKSKKYSSYLPFWA